MIVAINPKAASELTQSFRKRQVGKKYVAFACGLPSRSDYFESEFELDGTIEVDIRFDKDEKM